MHIVKALHLCEERINFINYDVGNMSKVHVALIPVLLQTARRGHDQIYHSVKLALLQSVLLSTQHSA
jgi:hypothetical protein